MKILSVNNTADIYGASRCMERVFGSFVDHGHEVHAVLPEHGPLETMLAARGVTVHIHEGLSIIDRGQIATFGGMLRFLVMFPYSVAWLAVLMLRLRIDVVHTNTVVMPTPPVAAFITGRKHVWHVRELLAEFGSLWKPFQRYVYHLSSAIIAISECVKDQFDVALRDRIEVIYDGIDGDDARADPALSKAFRNRFPEATQLVGVVGRIKFHRKGQEVLIRAAGLLKEKYPRAHYVVIGSASSGNESHVIRLRELITECGLDSAVTLTGDMQNLSHIFAALDIAIAPSVQAEPFGIVVMEAMAVGTPVIGSRGGGIAEQIVDGATGFLFPPGDPEGLAQALDILLGDEKLRFQMGEDAIKHVQANFTLASTYREMAALFSKVLAGDQNHAPHQSVENTGA